VNYEVLCNAFSTKLIDLSKAEIFKLKTSEMKKDELEALLKEQNEYSLEKFADRFEKMQRLKELDEELAKKKLQKEEEKRIVQERMNKSFSDIK
jgi:hypothetical protein